MNGLQAGVMACAFLVVGYLVYSQLCRRISPTMERDGVLSIAVGAMMALVAYLSMQIFPGRAAFLITGAVMATCMSANVFFWIIPGQRRMVAALRAGQAPDPLDGMRGKQRSVHNTYFTLPVLIAPIVPFGYYPVFQSYPGSQHLSADTFANGDLTVSPKPTGAPTWPMPTLP